MSRLQKRAMRNYWNQNRQNYNNAIDNFFESMVSQINVEILVAHQNTAFGDDGKKPTNNVTRSII